jgi:DNA-binding response OmpR family regulator
MRVLVLDDDAALAEFLRRSFEEIHCAVDVGRAGTRAGGVLDHKGYDQGYDVLILDLDTPDSDGMLLLQQIRAQNGSVPVIALTSRRQLAVRVKTLDLGADDYLAKPFAFAELAARARALLRRTRRPSDPVLRVGDLELNRLERRASRAGKSIDLTPKELSLLEYLMQNEGQCVTRTMIIENVWRMQSDTMTNVVDVYVNYLRKKIDEGLGPKLIHTVRGSGYQLSLERSSED